MIIKTIDYILIGECFEDCGNIYMKVHIDYNYGEEDYDTYRYSIAVNLKNGFVEMFSNERKVKLIEKELVGYDIVISG